MSKGQTSWGLTFVVLWEDIPEDFECPLCMVGKDQFSEG